MVRAMGLQCVDYSFFALLFYIGDHMDQEIFRILPIFFEFLAAKTSKQANKQKIFENTLM